MLNPMVIFLIAAAYEKVFLNDFYYNFCIVFYFFLKKTLAVAIKNITIGFSMKKNCHKIKKLEKKIFFDFFRKGVHHEFIFKITIFALKSSK
jgi:hypothetical protein